MSAGEMQDEVTPSIPPEHLISAPRAGLRAVAFRNAPAGAASRRTAFSAGEMQQNVQGDGQAALQGVELQPLLPGMGAAAAAQTEADGRDTQG